MPVVLSYPGVYIEEVASGVRTIAGVATSIAAFVGRTRRGPTNDPIVINSYSDFERRFGGLWVDSPLSFAVRDFYLNGGGQAIIVRLFHPQFANAAARTAALAAATTEAQTGADLVAAAATTAAGVAGATAASVAAAAQTAAGTAVGTAGRAAGNTVAAAAAAASAAAATPAAVVTAAGAAVAGAVADAAAAAAPVTSATLDANGLGLQAASPGDWGNTLRARIDHDVNLADPAAATMFNLFVREGLTGETETFRNVSVDPAHPRRVDQVLKNGSSLVRAPILPAARPTASVTTAGKDPWATNAPPTNALVADTNRAGNGNALTGADDFTPTGAAAAKQGLYALDKADQFNLLCIPPHIPEGSIESTLIDDAITYCTARRAVMIVDPPDDWDSKEDAIGGIDTAVGTASANAAIFFPRIVQQNPLRDNREEAFAPCGAVAGLIARIDGQRGVWKAPAGLEATLVNAPKLSVPLTDLENGELNPLGINCLRALPGAGRVVWGSRTRRGNDRLADQWKYIPVRRTALYIEESLYRGTQWVVFEPNDEPLWASIRLNVGAFMHGLFRQGAFQGSTPRDAYFVKCDKETTLQADIDRGIVNIIVGFAPLKPAEFVVIRLQQIAGEIQA